MIDINLLSEQEKIALICLFYARLPGVKSKAKGLEPDVRSARFTPDAEIISKRYPRTYNAISNDKDYMEPLFQERNGRIGYDEDSKTIANRGKAYTRILDRYRTASDEELEKAVSAIIKECMDQINTSTCISINLDSTELIEALTRGDRTLTIDKMKYFYEGLRKGQTVFISIKCEGNNQIDSKWYSGLLAIGHVSRAPYERNHKKTDGWQLFKIDIAIDILLPRSIEKHELFSFPETYDASFIGPETKASIMKTVAPLKDAQAAALIDAIFAIMPEEKARLEAILPESLLAEAKKPHARLVSAGSGNNTWDEDSPDNPINLPPGLDAYTKDDFLNEVFLPEEEYGALMNLLEDRKNIILQGAPGVGKTFMARRLAYALLGCKDNDHVQFVQFHQSYTYEDFVAGYKPTEDGFELKAGPFYDFCGKARKDPARPYVFIIDEINRGNISKIFGELLMLIETDKRGQEIQLLHSSQAIGPMFSVPANVYIIGMMNTADRSLAMIDYALRRRFAFYQLKPAFDEPAFLKHVKSFRNELFNELLDKVKMLNVDIRNDSTLGEGFEIGHSYFCLEYARCQFDEKWKKSLTEYTLIPLIKEYWFDNPSQVSKWANLLRS